ncbi:hypothetical protein OG948_02525 [Embleya sp. NBC_00888]|uniref:hypothetical protein n=1 Tax=Embleya sp. NBC_00888 TaxID=2975960 RepID=UPI00386DA86E|nr:hypothetical protein OG948_02525 [Embleya sp. NBC_00888]
MRYPDGSGPTAKQRAQREQVRLRAAEMFTQGLAPPLVAKALRVPLGEVRQVCGTPKRTCHPAGPAGERRVQEDAQKREVWRRWKEGPAGR